MMKNKKIAFLGNTDHDPYICVYYIKDWDGAIISKMSLKEKSQFFSIANEIKEIFLELCKLYCEESIVIGPFENYTNYCNWKDVNTFKIVKTLKKELSPKQQLIIKQSEQIDLIENLIEANMCYLSQASFLLAQNQVLFQVQHHTSIVIYAKDIELLIRNIQKVLSNFSDDWNVDLWHNQKKLSLK